MLMNAITPQMQPQVYGAQSFGTTGIQTPQMGLGPMLQQMMKMMSGMMSMLSQCLGGQGPMTPNPMASQCQQGFPQGMQDPISQLLNSAAGLLGSAASLLQQQTGVGAGLPGLGRGMGVATPDNSVRLPNAGAGTPGTTTTAVKLAPPSECGTPGAPPANMPGGTPSANSLTKSMLRPSTSGQPSLASLQSGNQNIGALLNSFDKLKRPGTGRIQMSDLQAIAAGSLPKDGPLKNSDLIVTPELQKAAAWAAKNLRLETADARHNGGDMTPDQQIGLGDLRTALKQNNQAITNGNYRL